LDDSVWLTEQHHVLHQSLGEIAVSLGCSRSAVQRAFERLGIAAIQGRAGELHPRWKGGKRRNGLYRYWSKPERDAERMRRLQLTDNHCEWCGQSAVPEELHLHHIIPLHNSRDSSPENLALLCPGCHGKADRLFTAMAKEFFTSNGCPGLSDAASTLRSTIREVATQSAG
jgi:AraC-like DNA-binding protein